MHDIAELWMQLLKGKLLVEKRPKITSAKLKVVTTLIDV